jgi:hypothetical protein
MGTPATRIALSRLMVISSTSVSGSHSWKSAGDALVGRCANAVDRLRAGKIGGVVGIGRLREGKIKGEAKKSEAKKSGENYKANAPGKIS